jgi:hypothetical protein
LLGTYQVFKDALVERPLVLPALVKHVVPVFQAVPVRPEGLQTMRVDV